MSKPDFKTMTRKELKQYILTHRDDEEAWEEFTNHPRPNAIHFPANMPIEEQEARLKQLIEEANS
jgi:hypothetical protein